MMALITSVCCCSSGLPGLSSRQPGCASARHQSSPRCCGRRCVRRLRMAGGLGGCGGAASREELPITCPTWISGAIRERILISRLTAPPAIGGGCRAGRWRSWLPRPWWRAAPRRSCWRGVGLTSPRWSSTRSSARSYLASWTAFHVVGCRHRWRRERRSGSWLWRRSVRCLPMGSVQRCAVGRRGLLFCLMFRRSHRSLFGWEEEEEGKKT